MDSRGLGGVGLQKKYTAHSSSSGLVVIDLLYAVCRSKNNRECRSDDGKLHAADKIKHGSAAARFWAARPKGLDRTGARALSKQI